MQNILIVEDVPEVIQWMSQLIGGIFPSATLTSVSSIDAAKKQIADNCFELVLLDLGLPDGCGTDLITPLKSTNPSALCVVLTIFDDASHLFAALKAGADGYLIKSADDPEIKIALEGIVAGRPPLSASIATQILAHFHVPQVACESVKLTPREEEMLILISNGYSTREAANCLGIAANTAAGYLKATYQKLQVCNRAEATLRAVQLGLVKPD